MDVHVLVWWVTCHLIDTYFLIQSQIVLEGSYTGYLGSVIGVDDIKIENGDCKSIFITFIFKGFKLVNEVN